MKPMECCQEQVRTTRAPWTHRWRRVASAALRTACLTVSPLVLLALCRPADASIAYGSINNFDTVNDTGVVCHGFEIELDDVHSKDITYTYDWNHYGVPLITEDNSNPVHPKVFVRYESKKNPDGTWASYTAIPSGPIGPTQGHQFTNPSLNFGGEHFGVGFYGSPTAVKYSWLKDDGTGHLVFAGAVYISTPAFTYVPPAPAVQAQVQAVIVPPPPPALPPLEFGTASWVKETRTSTHNNGVVKIGDLISDDPADPNAKSWRNGEPSEVEVEWQLLQTDFNADNGGPNGEMVGAPEDLPNNDEVITRRYDFFKYVGPIDPQTGEALADTVAADGIHGVGVITVNGVDIDLSTVVVVGDYVGAQMAGFDAAGKIGLIDHLQDGELNTAYVDRSMVIAGTPPIVTVRTGALPNGMTFDETTGVLSGTPTESGAFSFSLHSTDAAGGDVTNTYTLNVVNPLPTYAITTSALPVGGGTTSGDGTYTSGDSVIVVATENPGYHFVSWTESGAVVSTSHRYTFTAGANHTLVANFTQLADVTGKLAVSLGGFRLNRATGRYVQTITLKNVSGAAITGPLSFVLDALAANASLHAPDGSTALLAPLGSPFKNAPGAGLAAGSSMNLVLEFANPTNARISYTARVIAGVGQR